MIKVASCDVCMFFSTCDDADLGICIAYKIVPHLSVSRLRFLLTLRKWPGYYDAFAKFDYLGGELDRMRNQRNPYRS